MSRPKKNIDYSTYQKDYYEANKETINKKRQIKRLKEKAHTVASPSSLHRLLVCPASAALTRYLPEQPATSYAQEGTIFHDIMQSLINLDPFDLEKNRAEHVIHNTIEKYRHQEPPVEVSDEIEEELSTYAMQAYDWFKVEAAGAKEIFTELKLPMFYSDKDFGSLDCAILHNNTLMIIDWKYGKGVDVSVENNPQLIAYTVSMLKYLAANGFDIRQLTSIYNVIYQPRTYKENKEKICAYTVHELVDASKLIKSGVDLVYDILSTYKNKNSKIVTSNLNPTEDGCRFCPAKMCCKKYIKQNEDLLGDLVSKAEKTKIKEEKELVSIGKLFEESLPKLEKFYKEIQDYYMSLPELPDGVYSANRAGRLSYIDDQEKVISLLQENGVDGIDHSVKLITITELKKLVKKLENKEQILAEITEKKEGSKYITFNSDCNLVDNI